MLLDWRQWIVCFVSCDGQRLRLLLRLELGAADMRAIGWVHGLCQCYKVLRHSFIWERLRERHQVERAKHLLLMKLLFTAIKCVLTFDVSLNWLLFVVPLEALMHDWNSHAHSWSLLACAVYKVTLRGHWCQFMSVHFDTVRGQISLWLALRKWCSLDKLTAQAATLTILHNLIL